MKRTQLLTLLGLMLVHQAFSQCVPLASDYLHGRNVRAMVHNSGDMWWDLISKPEYLVPNNASNNNPTAAAFASSIWIGALDGQGNIHTAGQTYRQSGIDFFPGPYKSNGNYLCNPQPFSFFHDPEFPSRMIALSSGKVLLAQSNLLQVLDPNTGNFITRSLPSNRTNYDPIELNDGRIWLVGQDLGNSIQPLPTFILDTANWAIQTSVTPNFFHHHSTLTRLNNGKILVAGFSGCEIFDPVVNQISVAPAMGTPRAGHSAVLLANGKVLVAGGNSFGFEPFPVLSSTELYDPVANSWSSGPGMAQNRALSVMTRIANGKVVIVGGGNNLEVYDPALNTITVEHQFPGELGLTSAILDGEDEIYFSSNNSGVLLMHKYRGGAGTLENIQTHMGQAGAAYIGNNKAILKVRDAGLGEFVLFDTEKDQLVGERYQKIWKVTKTQIDQFRADFANGTLNYSNYPDILDWPARGDVNAGEPSHLAPFYDVDGDGRYRPAINGDYPCIRGDQAMWWVFNDDAGLHTETGGQKLGLQVEVMAYTFDCATRNCADTLVDYATFYHYKVTNMSPNSYTDAYMGLWSDIDLGNYQDDLIGCDPNLDLAFVYNSDNNDESPNGYGLQPPAAGTIFLNTPQETGMTHFMTYNNDFGLTGNPSVGNDYYNYLRSFFKDGQHLVDNGQNGYPGTAPGPAVNHFFSGDPGFCGGSSTGWSEISANRPAGDRRYLQSFGPFPINAGQVVEMDMAMLYARGNSNLASVCRLKDLATTLKPWWMAQDSSCPTVILGNASPQLPMEKAQLTLAPNPSQGSTTLILPEMVKEGKVGIWNCIGQSVFSAELPFGANQLIIDQPTLPAGVYQIVAEMNGRKMRANWVIAR